MGGGAGGALRPGVLLREADSVAEARMERAAALRILDDAALQAPSARWPFEGRSLADVFAWTNVELTKNAAEIGYVRFLKGTATA